jgi:hypothetical protein
MFITIINDCKDANAVARQETRTESILGKPVSFLGVNSDIEAAGNLIDVLDAGEGKKGVVLVNVAPRNGAAHKWKNGTPFGYFWYKKTLVVSSIDGYVLSLIKKLEIAEGIEVFDIPTVLKSLVEKGVIDDKLSKRVAETQFRSFEFVPRAAGWLIEGIELPSETWSLESVPDIEHVVWWIDNFGNIKTTLTRSELEVTDGMARVLNTTLPFYEHLAEVKDGESACVLGSSGIEENRFVEIVAQGKPADGLFNVSTGDKVL